MRPLGTTTSWLNLSDAIVFSDSDSSRRTRHSSSRSRLVARAQDLGRARVAAGLLDQRRASSATASAMPSTSSSSSAPVPSGASDRTFRLRATASSESPSISSSAAGTTRSRMTLVTACGRGTRRTRNVARSVDCTGGFGHQPQDDPA